MPTLTAPNIDLARLAEVIEHTWGYDSFLPLQREAMTCCLSHRDSVVVLPTGGGKSLCFQAPALCMDGMALVVSPLISLMKDQVDALRACGVAAAFINSTLSMGERRQVADQIGRGEIKLLYAAPERVLADRTLDFLKSANVSLVAVDEAHCISAWGHDFRPEYRGLRVLKEAFPNVGIHAYTATASEQVRQDIAEQLGLDSPAMLVGSFDRPNLVYRLRPGTNKFPQICEIIERHKNASGIVYCISRKEVDRTAESLCQLGYRAAPYHAGMSDQDRHDNQEAFIEERIDVIVATVAFGMGIDKSNVRYVIHAGMPKSLEHYQQESGRAGRDGLEAECWLFHSGSDSYMWKQMLDKSEPAARDGALRALDAMESFCKGVECRHRAIVRYFGQELEAKNCGACDVCLSELDQVSDAVVLSQKILSCVARLNERFGADYVAKVLSGSKDKRILQFSHNQLSTYGLLQDYAIAAIRSWIEQLVSQGFLTKTGEYNVVQLTTAGRALLKGEGAPQLLQPAETKADAETKRAARTPADSWEGVDRDLFEQLRELRAAIAAERGVPAYIVFGDTALRDMARRRPSTLDSFRHVNGVGDKKLEDFGDTFVTTIAEYCRANEVAMDVAPPAARPKPPVPSGVNQSALPAFELFRNGASIEEVMSKLNRARSTVASYLSEFLRHDLILDPSPWVDSVTARRIEAAIEEIGPQPRLAPIYEHLGGQVSYDDIRIVAACLRNRE